MSEAMSLRPQTRPVTLEYQRRSVAQGQALVIGEVVAIVLKPSAPGVAWFKSWADTARLESREITVRSADKEKRTLSTGFMKLYYWNERGANPRSDGWERYSAILQCNQPYSGSFAQKLWKAALTDEKPWYAEECLIYSDVSFVGHLRDVGPFSVLNNLPTAAPTMASLTLRYSVYSSATDFSYTFLRLDPSHSKYAQFRERIYISISDELAALISVATGRRLLGGCQATRWFGQSDDPFGDPRDPGTPPEIRSRKRSNLPYYFSGERTPLALVEPVLRRYFGLQIELASKFLRAASLYRKALLQSDIDADIAWIWSVGAIEALAEVPGEHDGVTGRFVKFLLAHLPPPPSVRPPHHQIDWTTLKRPFEQIYSYRSDFLHAGLPFPSPMTHPPENFSHHQGVSWFAEKPPGGTGYGGTTYEHDASPMQLHTFLHITQGALLKWLELASLNQAAPEPPPAPEVSNLHVEVFRTDHDQLRVVLKDSDGDSLREERIPTAELVPSPLKDIIPLGYEVTTLTVSKRVEDEATGVCARSVPNISDEESEPEHGPAT